MGVLFDRTMVILQAGLGVRRHQQSVTAGNIANVDTPGFRARQADFSAAMERVQSRLSVTSLRRTAEGHMRGGAAAAEPLKPGTILPEYDLDPDITLSDQPVRADGNNVSLEAEMARLAANAAEFRALTAVTRKKFGMMKYALDKS
jgi:flagellar basal-body rod protein FlgB